MAVTIASTAILISAQTAPLQRDMRAAQKIVGDGAGKMKDEVDRKGSLWGTFFRSAFAMSMFHRLARNIREGVNALKDSGDVAGEAAAKGLKEYDEAIKRIQMSLAKAFAPAIGKIGNAVANIGNAFEDLVDVFQFDVFGDGLLEELKRRDLINRELVRQIELQKKLKAAQIEFNKEWEFFFNMQQDLTGPITKLEAFVKRVEGFFAAGGLDLDFADMLIEDAREKTRKILGLIPDKTPLEEYQQQMENIKNALEHLLIEAGQAGQATGRAIDKLMKDSGFETTTPFDKFNESLSKLNALRHAGLLTEERYAQLLGIQVQELDKANEKAAERAGPPEALMRGTAAAFSAINAFQRGQPDSKLDAAKVQAEAAKRAADQRAEQIRLGKEANKHLQKIGEIEAMGP